MRLRPLTLVSAAALTLSTGLLAGCDLGGKDTPDPSAYVTGLASGLSTGDLTGYVFGGETSGAEAQAAYEEVVAGLDGAEPQVVGSVGEITESEGDAPASATATFDWSWDLGGRQWAYNTDAHLEYDGTAGRWKATWARAIIQGNLGEGGHLEVTPIGARRGAILGNGEEPLVTAREVTRFGIDMNLTDRVTAVANAPLLAELVGIDPATYAEAVEAAGDKAFVEAITLRKEDISVEIARRYQEISGARAIPGTAELAPTPDFASAVLGKVGPVTAEMIAEDPDAYAVGDVVGLSGLEARYDEQLTGTDGVVVEAVGGDGTAEVFRVDGEDGTALTTTMDLHAQQVAEDALAAAGPSADGPPAAVVAIRPSDGAILAAANSASAAGTNYATYGQAEPGSTFKTVSALALLRSGMTPDSMVDCPPSVIIDGYRISNYGDYPAAKLGRITLRDALANSCNTAFAGNAERLGSDAIASAAASLGLGIDHDLGFPAFFGQVPEPGTSTELAASAIGQGKILASPMVMATVAASIQSGRTVVPQLITTVPVEVPGEALPLTAQESAALRNMMRTTVTAGPSQFLLDVPGKPVIAKTGTAEFDRDGERLKHTWMIAAQGDLAVAVYVDVGASGSGTAGPILEAFLRGM